MKDEEISEERREYRKRVRAGVEAGLEVHRFYYEGNAAEGFYRKEEVDEKLQKIGEIVFPVAEAMRILDDLIG